MTKELTLGILASASGIAAFWFWSRAIPLIAKGEAAHYSDFLLPAISLLLAASLFSLAALFIRSRRVVYAGMGVAAAAPYFFIPTAIPIRAPYLYLPTPSLENPVLWVLVASVLLVWFALHRIRREFDLSLGFSLTKTLKTGLPLYFTVASLTVSTFYFSLLDEREALAAILPKPAFDAIVRTLRDPLQTLTGLPEINFNETVDALLTRLVGEELRSRGTSLSQLSKGELAHLIFLQRERLSKNFGIAVGGKERIADLFYRAVTNRLGELVGPYRQYLPAVSVALFFFAFKALTVPFLYLTLLLTFLLLRLIRAAKMLKSEKHTVEVERLTLS